MGIDGGKDGEHHGGGDQQGLAVGWPENGRESAVSLPGTTSPVAIVATVELVGGLKMLALTRRTYLG